MRRFFKLSVVCLAAGVVSACGHETIVETPAIPTAGVRFINAVPDTGAFDFRFVDIVENNAHWNQSFRNNPTIGGGVTASSGILYKNTRAGSRHFAIFRYGTDQATASTVIHDAPNTTLEAGKLYTVIIWGYAHPTGANRPASAPAMRVDVIEEAVTVPAGQVSLRLLNATGDAVDGRHYVSGGTVPAGATWANVAALSASPYVSVAPAQIRVNARLAGGATALTPSDALAIIGAGPQISGSPCDPATQKCDLEALPGTTQAGSALTAILFPRSVAGTIAPQSTGSTSIPSYASPALSWVWDRRPPRAPGT